MRSKKISLAVAAALALGVAWAWAADAAAPAAAEPKAEAVNPMAPFAGDAPLPTPDYYFWGLVSKDVMPKYLWGALAMMIAAALGAAIGYHPLRVRNIGVKKEEAEVPKALILIAVAGSVICGLVGEQPMMAFALFGFGSFIRFRTQMKSPKETVVIFICGGIGCLCGLHAFELAIMGTAFVWGLIWILDRRMGGTIERLTVILKGFGPECQVAVKSFKEKLEAAGVEVVSSKVSLKKGNVTILMDKHVNVTTDDLEEILLAGDDVARPKSIEWIRGE
ncbi:MAG TPA: hypothetical protein DCM87_12295 [Planctomycetes bacterium]|nr:hypothetical protein [Planctomycetota bacterium]